MEGWAPIPNSDSGPFVRSGSRSRSRDTVGASIATVGSLRIVRSDDEAVWAAAGAIAALMLPKVMKALRLRLAVRRRNK